MMTRPRERTEQSNSKTWHQYFVQNLRLLRSQLEHGKASCKEEVESRRGSDIAWIPVHLKLFCSFEQFKATLEENKLILHCKTTCCYRTTSPSIYHFGSSRDFHSIIQSGLIPGGKDVKKGKHAVFFTAVNPMFVDQHKEVEYDLKKPRIAVCTNNWKVHQTTVYGCYLKVAQSKRLKFYQTRSNVIILYNTLPAVCIKMVVNMKSREKLYSKMYQSPEFTQRIVLGETS